MFVNKLYNTILCKFDATWMTSTVLHRIWLFRNLRRKYWWLKVTLNLIGGSNSKIIFKGGKLKIMVNNEKLLERKTVLFCSGSILIDENWITNEPSLTFTDNVKQTTHECWQNNVCWIQGSWALSILNHIIWHALLMDYIHIVRLYNTMYLI